MTSTNRFKATPRTAVVLGALAMLALACAAGCAAPTAGESTAGTADELRVTSTFVSHGTGYYPSSSSLEGGFSDRLGKPLKTLQSFLNGNAAYASVAMDGSAFSYGTRLRIKELDAKYGRSIIFRVVDTGGAFRGKGRTRIDICTANMSASLDPTINGALHIDVIDETTPDALPPASSSSGGASGGSGTSGGGAACSTDGHCNPGSDGSGLICSAGQCVPGCHSDGQCPGNTSCVAGQCR
jgi:3D (Asp-Asp-Asp) domain-containing protein